MKTKEEIRQTLPGHEIDHVILMEQRVNGNNKILRFKHVIRGFFNKLETNSCYWVETYDWLGPSCRSFKDLNEAVDYYVSL